MSKLSHFILHQSVSGLRRQSPPLHFNLHLRFHLTFVDTEIESGVLATIGANYMQAAPDKLHHCHHLVSQQLVQDTLLTSIRRKMSYHQHNLHCQYHSFPMNDANITLVCTSLFHLG